MDGPLEVGSIADYFVHVVLCLQASEKDCLITSFSFIEVGVAAVVRDFPSAQILADVGKDILMSRGVSELNAVLLTKIAGAVSGAPNALRHQTVLVPAPCTHLL
jgi:hypothetical protein